MRTILGLDDAADALAIELRLLLRSAHDDCARFAGPCGHDPIAP